MLAYQHHRRTALGAMLGALASTSRAFPLGAPSAGKLIIGGNPGSGPDIVGRRLQALWDEQRLGQFDVENVLGGGGMTAINRLLAEPTHSNTLLLSSSGAVCVTPFISKVENFDPEEDLTPLAILAKTAFVLFTSAKSHYRNFAEFRHHFSAKDQVLNYGVLPIYGANHIGGYALIQKLGIEGKAIPYRQNSQFLPDVAEQRLDVGIHTVAAIKGMLDQQRLRPLAVMSANRVQALPDVPALKELGLADVAFEGWIGLFHRSQLAPSSMDKVRHSLRQIFLKNEPQINLADNGYQNAYKDTQAASAFVRSEIVRYRKIIRGMNLS